MSTVYTIERGEYSDHQILAAFESKDERDQYLARYNAVADRWHDAFDGELHYFPAGAVPEPRHVYFLRIDTEGTITAESGRTEWFDDPPRRPDIHDNGNAARGTGVNRETLLMALRQRVGRINADREGIT